MPKRTLQMRLKLYISVALLFLSLGQSIHNAPAQDIPGLAHDLPVATVDKIQRLLNDEKWQGVHIGVAVKELGTVNDNRAFPAFPALAPQPGLIFNHDANKRFLPASNTKLFTSASALYYLGAAKTFPTRLLSRAPIEAGVLQGDLFLAGGGDPSLTGADLDALAQELAAKGLKTIDGDIIGDGSDYTAESFGGRYPDGWTLDDTLWYYGPEISALAINRNQVDITAVDSPNAGGTPVLNIEPTAEGLTISSNVTPGPAKSTSYLNIDRAGADGAVTDTIYVNARVAPGGRATQGVAVPNPPRWAAAILKAALIKRGIAVKGVARSGARGSSEGLSELAHHDSAPLGTLLQRLLKRSDNLYAEMMLHNAAFYTPRNIPEADSHNTTVRGHQLLNKWLRESAGVSGMRFTDGSGLSRYNLITPAAMVEMLAAIDRLKEGKFLWDALPIAGVDGTLRGRMKGTAAAGNVHAKTGSFSIVSTLSGYVTTRNKRRLAFSILTNFGNTDEMRDLQNQICIALAESN